MNSSFIHRDFFEVVGSGITAFADSLVNSKLGSFAGRIARSFSRDYALWEETEDALQKERGKEKRSFTEWEMSTFQQVFSSIARYIPEDSPSFFWGITSNTSFSNFFKANPGMRAQFLKSTENTMDLFRRAHWDISKMSPAWQQALEETQKYRKESLGRDTVTISGANITPERLQVIARYIPNVKKLCIKDSIVDKKIAKLCGTIFPKLEEITYTNIVEPKAYLSRNTDRYVHPPLAPNTTPVRIMHKTRSIGSMSDARYVHFIHRTRRVIHDGDRFVREDEHRMPGKLGEVMSEIPGDHYDHLEGTATLKIERPEEPDSKAAS